MWFFSIVLSMAKSLGGDDWFSFDVIFQKKLLFRKCITWKLCSVLVDEKHEFVTTELSSDMILLFPLRNCI